MQLGVGGVWLVKGVREWLGCGHGGTYPGSNQTTDMSHVSHQQCTHVITDLPGERGGGVIALYGFTMTS